MDYSAKEVITSLNVLHSKVETIGVKLDDDLKEIRTTILTCQASHGKSLQSLSKSGAFTRKLVYGAFAFTFTSFGIAIGLLFQHVVNHLR